MDPHLSSSRTIALYGPLLDDRRFEDWGRLFTEDAIWSMPGATFEGRRAIIEGVGAMEPPITGLVRLDGSWLFEHRTADIDPDERPSPAFLDTPGFDHGPIPARARGQARCRT